MLTGSSAGAVPAEASGAPVLRDQGPIGRLGTARPICVLEHRELGKHCRSAKAVLIEAECLGQGRGGRCRG
jgi:hypothetical protein